MPQPLFEGSNQEPLWSTSPMTPEARNGWMFHVPDCEPTCHVTFIDSGWTMSRRSEPTVVNPALRPLAQRCFRSGQAAPTLVSSPCAVYQIGFPASSYVNHITATCPPELKMSKPWPERAGFHQCPCANGERSATVAAMAAAENNKVATAKTMRRTM